MLLLLADLLLALLSGHGIPRIVAVPTVATVACRGVRAALLLLLTLLLLLLLAAKPRADTTVAALLLLPICSRSGTLLLRASADLLLRLLLLLLSRVALSSRLPGRRAVASVRLVRVVVRVPVRAVAVLRLAVRHAVVLIVARVPVRPAVERLGRLLLVVLLLTRLLLLLSAETAAAELRGGILCRTWSRHGLLRLLVLLLLVASVVVVQVARWVLLMQAVEARVVIRVALAWLSVLLLVVVTDG